MMKKLGNPSIENYWTVIPQTLASIYADGADGYQNGGNWQSALISGGLEGLNNLVVVAGIPLLINLFNKILYHLPLHNDVKNNLDTGWILRKTKQNDFDVSIGKRYVKTAAGSEMIDLLRTARIIFSMGSIYLLLGIVIPWLKLKQRQKNSIKQQSYDLNSPVKAFFTHPNSDLSEKSTVPLFQKENQFPLKRVGSIKNRISTNPGSAHILQNTLKTANPPLNFSGLSKIVTLTNSNISITKLLNDAGNLIEHTTGGDIAANDACATIGESYINDNHKHPLNALQTIANNATDLYFYLFFVPHIFTNVNWLSQKTRGVPILLEPQIAKMLHKEILKHTDPKRLTTQDLKLLIYGEKNRELVNALEVPLRYYMRSTNLEKFLKLYHLEGQAYLGPKEWQETVNQDLVKQFLKTNPPDPLLTNNSEISLELIDQLRQLMSRQSYPAWNEQRAMEASLQFAYRHTAGLSKPEFMFLLKENHLEENLTPRQFEKLVSRLDRMLQQDTWDTLNSIFRRGIVFAQNSLGASHPSVLHAEELSNWLEKSAMERQPLPAILHEELEKVLSLLKESGKKHPQAFFNGMEMFRKMLQEEGSFSIETFNALMPALKQSCYWQDRTAYKKLKKLALLFKDNTTLSTGISEQITGTFRKMTSAIGKQSGQQHILDLLTYYDQEMKNLLTNGGRIFSSYLNPRDQELTLKIRELLEGGTTRESAIIRKGLRITGNLPESYREPFSLALKKKQQLDSLVRHYFDTMMDYLEKGKTDQPLINRINQFYRESRNIRYFSMTLGYVAAMWGIIYFMPLMQKTMKWFVDLYLKDTNLLPSQDPNSRRSFLQNVS